MYLRALSESSLSPATRALDAPRSQAEQFTFACGRLRVVPPLCCGREYMVNKDNSGGELIDWFVGRLRRHRCVDSIVTRARFFARRNV